MTELPIREYLEGVFGLPTSDYETFGIAPYADFQIEGIVDEKIVFGKS